jgi:hypothetical protein
MKHTRQKLYRDYISEPSYACPGQGPRVASPGELRCNCRKLGSRCLELSECYQSPLTGYNRNKCGIVLPTSQGK